MQDFPSFMKRADNRVPQAQENTPILKDFTIPLQTEVRWLSGPVWPIVFPESTGTITMSIWSVSRVEYVVIIDGVETTLHAGDELEIPQGSMQGGRCTAGTRTIHAFGGPRVKPASEDTPFRKSCI
jgi:hypothetical protein